VVKVFEHPSSNVMVFCEQHVLCFSVGSVDFLVCSLLKILASADVRSVECEEEGNLVPLEMRCSMSRVILAV
jgi:hypothetical protein